VTTKQREATAVSFTAMALVWDSSPHS